MKMDEKKTTHVRLIREINSLLQDAVTKGGLSAAIGSIGAPVMTFCAGKADMVNDIPMQNEHILGIGSITKIFVAVVVFQLVEEGKLGLSDTIGSHLDPEVWHGIDDAETATITQLLSHTAGIDSWEDDPTWIIDGRGKALRPTHIWDKTETLDYIRRPKISAPSPGTWYYSNTNYTFLGLIIEKLTKSTAESEIRRRILLPLNMRNTYMEGFEPVNTEQATCRYHMATATFNHTAGIHPSFPIIQDGLIETTHSNLSVSWMAGGMMSTASDLLKLACALRDGELLKPSSMAAMQEWRPAGENREMGHGLFRMNILDKGTWIGHFGGVLGFTAGLWWQEDGDCAICVLGNVGTQHAGKVSSSVTNVVLHSDFLFLAAELVKTLDRTPEQGDH